MTSLPEHAGSMTMNETGMLTIYINKDQLRKAFDGGKAEFSQEFSPAIEPPTDNHDLIMLKIMLEQHNTKGVA